MYLNDDNKLTEFMLCFSVDEDNIITMKAWLPQNQQHSIETQIARGGLTAKLYNDLERTISNAIFNSQNSSVEYSLLRLSDTVVATILSATDPITGETRFEQKQKALQQINTLKACQQQNIAPLGLYEFALKVQEIGSKHFFSSKEQSRLQNILNEFKQALSELDDIKKFKHLEDVLKQFYSNAEIVVDLTRAEMMAQGMEKNYPYEAKQMRNQVKKITDLYIHKDNSLLELAKGNLYELMSYFEYSNDSTGRFDRDVIL
jgi:hypothetical protein